MGGICTLPACPGCLIEGSCVAAGTTHPEIQCLVCNPAANPVGWSDAAYGTPCSDGDLCHKRSCGDDGLCYLFEVTTCSVTGQCIASAACDPSTGNCVEVPKTDGTPCDDGNACTQTDTCQAGVCTGDPVNCPAPDACHVPGICFGNGVCSPPQPVKDFQTDRNNCGTCGHVCATGEACVGRSLRRHLPGWHEFLLRGGYRNLRRDELWRDLLLRNGLGTALRLRGRR